MHQPMNVPLYLEWSFWAVVVATVALILSQLPPVHILIRRAKLELELYSRILMQHKVGNPNVQFHLILTNTGGRSVKIKGIMLGIKREGKDVGTLPAQNYLQNPNDKTTVLFTSFSLKSKEEWAHIVNCLNYFSRADEKKYRNAEFKLKEDIAQKRKLPENKDLLVEADSKHVDEFVRMFDEHFVWNPGEYELHISIETSDKKKDIGRDYRFTLFESDSNELSRSKDDYKYGDGIYWDSGNHTGVVVQIVEA